MASDRGRLGDVVREVELSENMAAFRTGGLPRDHGPRRPPRARRDDRRRRLHAGAACDGPVSSPLTLRRHVLAFFQGNRYLIRDLVAYVARRSSAGGRVLDLYAGAGLFPAAAAAKGRWSPPWRAIELQRTSALNAAQELGAHGHDRGAAWSRIAMRIGCRVVPGARSNGRGRPRPAIRRWSSSIRRARDVTSGG